MRGWRGSPRPQRRRPIPGGIAHGAARGAGHFFLTLFLAVAGLAIFVLVYGIIFGLILAVVSDIWGQSSVPAIIVITIGIVIAAVVVISLIGWVVKSTWEGVRDED